MSSRVLAVPFLTKRKRIFRLTYFSPTYLCPGIFLPAIRNLSTPAENGFCYIYILKVSCSFTQAPASLQQTRFQLDSQAYR
jgi:hypothetical protein